MTIQRPRTRASTRITTVTILSIIIAVISIIVSVSLNLSVTGIESRFQALENSIESSVTGIESRFQALEYSIESFRIGLTAEINAIRSHLETIEKITSILEQRMDITTGERMIINQLLENVTDRLMAIEQALNQSQPPKPPNHLPVKLDVSYPQNGDEVDWMTSVTGNSSGIVTNNTLKIYLLVYPVESEGPWFVQNRPIVNPDGSWSGLVYFGRDPINYPEDIGDQFLLLAIVTTSDLQPGKTLTESEIPESTYQSLISGLVRK